MCVGDGETYERSAIEKYIAEKQTMLEASRQELEETNGESQRAQRALADGIRSPMGPGTLKSTGLVPALNLRRLAAEWRAKNAAG